MTQSFEEMLRIGRAGELLVAFDIQKRGFFTQELAAIREPNGGGPRAHGPNSQCIILPDLLVSGRGKTFPLEIKTKSNSTESKLSGSIDHGIGQRAYLHYREYEDQTGLPVVLGIFEQYTGELLVRSLRKLGPGRVCHKCRSYTRDGHCNDCKMDRGGMFFWPRESFLTFAQVAPPKDVPLLHDLILPPTLPLIDDLGAA
jgi:hypothetical protein